MVGQGEQASLPTVGEGEAVAYVLTPHVEQANASLVPVTCAAGQAFVAE